MNAFDKLCAALAAVCGLILLILGAVGLLVGCKAHFSLPPVLGVIPAFVGWGIVRSVYFAWKSPSLPLGAGWPLSDYGSDGNRDTGVPL